MGHSRGRTANAIGAQFRRFCRKVTILISRHTRCACFEVQACTLHRPHSANFREKGLILSYRRCLAVREPRGVQPLHGLVCVRRRDSALAGWQKLQLHFQRAPTQRYGDAISRSRRRIHHRLAVSEAGCSTCAEQGDSNAAPASCSNLGCKRHPCIRSTIPVPGTGTTGL